MNESGAARPASKMSTVKIAGGLNERRRASNGQDHLQSTPFRAFVPEASFTHQLSLERKRAERSRRHFLLMLLHAEQLLGGADRREISAKLIAAVLSATRETDVSGWYEDAAVAGTILTEIQTDDVSRTVAAVYAKVSSALLASLGLNSLNRIHVSFHLFPEGLEAPLAQVRPADRALYRDLSLQHKSRRVSRFLKRTMDITGSVLALTVLSPLLAAIAAAIKLTSKGPVLYRQTRLGQYGVSFTFLKFRCMYLNSDPSVLQVYVKRFISGSAEGHPAEDESSSVYKLTRDSRITRVGRLLRKTSLDELPQLWNVLSGSMSLVGPRPPIAYECISYSPWHWRRLLEVKPGLTGLWQVSGRSRLKFDDMVRLDLQYAKAWSLGLDLKILWQTPRAVFSGEGAY